MLPHLRGQPSIFSPGTHNKINISVGLCFICSLVSSTFQNPPWLARFPKYASKALWDVAFAGATPSFFGFYDVVFVFLI